MKDLELRVLNKKDKAAHAQFIKEMIEVDGKVIPTAAEIKATDLSFEDWLEQKNNEAKGIDLAEGRVPATLLFLFHQSQSKILGAVHIRHELNEYLLMRGGNIGYGIAPSERRKGYASVMLAMVLEFCKSIKLEKALITCDKDNIGSAKTIQKNGGVLENEVVGEDGTIVQRYWIKL